MDHLTITDIDASMVGVNHDIARLRVGHAGPTHEGAGGAQTAVAARETVAYKTGAVKAVRSNAAPGISATQLAVGTRNNGAAVNRLVRCVRRRSRSRSRGGLRRRGRSGRRSGRGRIAAIVGVLSRTGGVVAHRSLHGGAGVNAGLKCCVGFSLGGKLGLQLGVQGAHDTLGLSLLGVELVDLLLR